MKKLTTDKNTTGLNSGATSLAKKILVENIKISDVFKTLIPIKENDLEAITKSIEQNGFDVLHPVCIWKEENVLIDGHTRYQATINAGLNEIYCYEKSFDSEKDAITFAINEQLLRRNLDDGAKLLLIEKLDNLKTAGRPTSETDEPRDKGKSSTELAKKLGMSTRGVERARAVSKGADEETKEKIASGEMSINKAYNNLKKEDEKEPEVDEEMDSFDMIEIDLSDDSSDATDVDEDIPYAKKITLYQEVVSMDEHSLAVYLHAAQESGLSVSEWEEKLKTKE